MQNTHACILSCFLATFILTGTAWAQMVNPSKIEWDTSDHGITTRYEVGYYMTGAPSPVQTVSVPVAAVTGVDADTFNTPLPRPVLGNFTARMKACGAAAGGGEVCSEWSAASDPFSLSPRVLAALRLVP